MSINVLRWDSVWFHSLHFIASNVVNWKLDPKNCKPLPVLRIKHGWDWGFRSSPGDKTRNVASWLATSMSEMSGRPGSDIQKHPLCPTQLVHTPGRGRRRWPLWPPCCVTKSDPSPGQDSGSDLKRKNSSYIYFFYFIFIINILIIIIQFMWN